MNAEDRIKELEDALWNLYYLANEDELGKGWKRGNHGMRVAEIALRIEPRKSDYDDREFVVKTSLEVRQIRELVRVS